MIVLHVVISAKRLQEVLSRAQISSVTNGSGSRSRAGKGSTGVVSEAVLAASRDAHCRCENESHMRHLGEHVGNTYLHAGMPIVGNEDEAGVVGGGQLGRSLGAGCTHPNFVCQRLVRVRDRYGY